MMCCMSSRCISQSSHFHPLGEGEGRGGEGRGRGGEGEGRGGEGKGEGRGGESIRDCRRRDWLTGWTTHLPDHGVEEHLLGRVDPAFLVCASLGDGGRLPLLGQGEGLPRQRFILAGRHLAGEKQMKAA